jgi:hypothetical protein
VAPGHGAAAGGPDVPRCPGEGEAPERAVLAAWGSAHLEKGTLADGWPWDLDRLDTCRGSRLPGLGGIPWGGQWIRIYEQTLE